jgi:hypothetical protein
MALKKLAAIAALVAVATPSLAFDVKDTGPSTLFYVSIPLDSLARKDRELAYGLQLQGKREYQAVNIDSKMLNFLPMGGLEAKWIIAGVVAAGTAVAIASKDKGTTSNLQTQQTQHTQVVAAQKNAPAPCEAVQSCAAK